MRRSESCLVVMAGPRFGESIRLKEGINRVGSDPNADVYFITSLISEHHFSLIRRDNSIALKREGGITLVNNTSVEEVELKDGDMILAGGILLRYVEEGSVNHFYVGDLFYGRERRKFPRFSMISTADAYLPREEKNIEVLSVRTVGRGGIGLFCKEPVKVDAEVKVSLFAKDSNRVIVAESIKGKVVSVAHWKDSLFLLNICFDEPISMEHQPNLFRHLTELERLL
jgi:hypothetical protein